MNLTTYSRVSLRIGVVLSITIGATFAFGAAFRAFETRIAVALLHTLRAKQLSIIGTDSVQVFPTNHSPFRAVVTPSCSALASLVAIACLGSLTPSTGRRWIALSTALVTVAAGNVIRIAASIAFGLFAGRRSLVLFHDWVGNLLTFVYTLGGFVLMIFLMLPKRGTSLTESVT